MLVLCDPAFFFVDAPYSSGRVGLNRFSVKKESQAFFSWDSGCCREMCLPRF